MDENNNVQPPNPYGVPEEQPQQPVEQTAYQQSYGQSQPAAPYGAQQPGVQQPYGQPFDQQPFGQQATAQQPGAQQPYNQSQPTSPYVPYPDYSVHQPSKGKATGALVCGVLAILFAWIPFVGIILGVAAIVLAGAYLKNGGVGGGAKAGRICGILGIIGSVVTFALVLVVVFADFDSYGYDYDDYDYSYDAMANLTDEEKIARDVVTTELDKLIAGDEAMLEQIAALGEDQFKEVTGYTMEECGVDRLAYARAMTEGFSYTVTSVLADHEWEKEGFVASDARRIDIWDIIDEYYDLFDKKSTQNELQALGEDARKQRIGQIYMSAIQNVDYEDDLYLSIDVVYRGGEWVIDEQSWNEEMDYLFGL